MILKKIFFYQCGECREGRIEYKEVQGRETTKVSIRKCDKCKKQYFFKQFWDANLKPVITKTI